MIGPRIPFLLLCLKSLGLSEGHSVNAAQSSFFICRQPRGDHWQLGPLPPGMGQMMLIGWRRAPASPDAGVPETIATVLARALTAVARVTFPCSSVAGAIAEDWTPASGDLVKELGRPGLFRRMREAIGQSSATIRLLSTRRPETVVQLFDDARHPWWQQSQVGLLSAPEAIPPDCDWATWLSLLGGNWPAQFDTLLRSGVLGILRPGVDGDVAGLLSFTYEFGESVLTALEREVQRSSCNWGVLTEEEFSCQLAGGKF